MTSHSDIGGWADAMIAYMEPRPREVIQTMAFDEYAADLADIARRARIADVVIDAWLGEPQYLLDAWSVYHDTSSLPEAIGRCDPRARYVWWIMQHIGEHTSDEEPVEAPKLPEIDRGVCDLPEPWHSADWRFYRKILNVYGRWRDRGLLDVHIGVLIAAYHLDDERAHKIREQIGVVAERCGIEDYEASLRARLEEHKRTGESMSPIWVELGPCRGGRR